MLFKDIEVTNKKSVLKSFNLTEKEIDNFVVAFNKRVIAKDSKSLAIQELDNMNHSQEKVFCYLALIGYQCWIDNKNNSQNVLN